MRAVSGITELSELIVMASVHSAHTLMESYGLSVTDSDNATLPDLFNESQTEKNTNWDCGFEDISKCVSINESLTVSYLLLTWGCST